MLNISKKNKQSTVVFKLWDDLKLALRIILIIFNIVNDVTTAVCNSIKLQKQNIFEDVPIINFSWKQPWTFLLVTR